jgi:TolA-binding protein
MNFDLPGWSQFILALVAVGGAIGAHRLNRRGQVTQTAQQRAANELATRAQGFEEMEALVDRLNHEITRLEAKSDREAQAQARRCRSTLEHFVLAFTTLQGQVVAEAAKQAAEAAHVATEQHLVEDHPQSGDAAPGLS